MTFSKAFWKGEIKKNRLFGSYLSLTFFLTHCLLLNVPLKPCATVLQHSPPTARVKISTWTPFYHNRVSHVQPATDLHLTRDLSQGVSEVQFCFTRHSSNRTKEKVRHGSRIPSVRQEAVDWRWYPVSPFSWYQLVLLGYRSASCCIAPLSETQWYLVCRVAALCVMGLETLSVVVSCQPSLNIFICYRGSIRLTYTYLSQGAFSSCCFSFMRLSTPPRSCYLQCHCTIWSKAVQIIKHTCFFKTNH